MILVLGAGGQLGKEIQRYVNENSLFQHYIFKSREELDICDLSKLTEIVTNKYVEVIINCGAYTDVDGSEGEHGKELAYKVNYHGVSNLSFLSKMKGVRIIHISTDYVFDGKTTTRYVENDFTFPKQNYGMTKRMGEIALTESCDDYVIIRTSWLYSKFGVNLVNKIVNNEDMTMYGVVDEISTPTCAQDLTEFIMVFVNGDFEDSTGIFHFTNEGLTSVYDLIVFINNELGRERNVVPVNQTDSIRPTFSVLSKEKVKDELGYNVLHWSDSLREYLHEIRKN